MTKLMNRYPSLSAWVVLVATVAAVYLTWGFRPVYIMDAAFYGGMALVFRFLIAKPD